MQLSEQSYFYITLMAIILACMCLIMMVCVRYHEQIRNCCCRSRQIQPETNYTEVQHPPETKIDIVKNEVITS